MPSVDAIDRARPQKLYCQLAELLRTQIEKGRWEVGSQVPTEDRLCSTYNVSKATVRLAVDELVSLGYLKKFQGRGTFVRRRKPEHAIQVLTNLAENGICRNPSCLTQLLECSVRRPPDEVRAQLGLGEDDNCHYFLSSTAKLGSPYLLRRTWLPYGLLPGNLAGERAVSSSEESLYTFLEKACGQTVHRLLETIDVASVDAGDGELLGLDAGTPVLRSRQLCTAPGEVPFIFSELLYRTDTDARRVEYERLTP